MRVLNNRIWREFRTHFGRYLALFFMIVLGMYLVVSVAGMAETTIQGSKEYNDECCLQDGQFTTFIPLTDGQLEELEKEYGVIERIFSIDADVDRINRIEQNGNKDIIRIFLNRKKLNLLKLSEGRIPEAANELVIMNLYADRNNIKVGDLVVLAGKEYKVTGIGCVPDYNLTVKNFSDMTADPESFGIALLSDEGYEALLSTGKTGGETYTYSYKLADGADAKDLDDAISVKKLESGWELGVHIADVSHYVTNGSRLDEEARQRGTSVYFADRVIPMLPVELSNGCCSLNAGTRKLTFSCIMKLNEKAELIDYRFEKSIIESKVRGVYSEVNAIIDGTADEQLKEKYSPVYDEIIEAQKLAEILKAKAKRRGELGIETTELRFVLDEQGVCIGVSERERGQAEELIEQFMIMANGAAAVYAKSVGIPFVYRVHEAPDEDKLSALSELAAACGFQTRRIKEGVRQTDLAALIEKAKDTKYAGLISAQVLRTMAKARYDPRPLGHFGLSLEDYCHFTSPIRRYPDTSIHRILSDLVSGVPIDKIKKRYEEFAAESSKLSSDYEIRAVRAERDTEKCYAAEYMRAHLGEVYDGVVSGVTNKGIFVMIPNGIEGFVDLLSIDSAQFIFDGKTTTTDSRSGVSYCIGDEVKIEVAAASVAMGTIDFVLK